MSTITTTYRGDMLFETKMGSHTLTIDVPANMAGKDRGPTPPELFIASLGSCVAAFVADYCGRVGVDTRDMSVDVSFEKEPDPLRLVADAVGDGLNPARASDGSTGSNCVRYHPNRIARGRLQPRGRPQRAPMARRGRLRAGPRS